jgi:hypothetical protein
MTGNYENASAPSSLHRSISEISLQTDVPQPPSPIVV